MFTWVDGDTLATLPLSNLVAEPPHGSGLLSTFKVLEYGQAVIVDGRFFVRGKKRKENLPS